MVPQATSIRVPGGVWRSAFSSRFATACVSNSWSPLTNTSGAIVQISRYPLSSASCQYASATVSVSTLRFTVANRERCNPPSTCAIAAKQRRSPAAPVPRRAQRRSRLRARVDARAPARPPDVGTVGLVAFAGRARYRTDCRRVPIRTAIRSSMRLSVPASRSKSSPVPRSGTRRARSPR